MTGSLKRTDRAERDLLAIWAYIASDNPVAADRVLDDLDAASRALADFPLLGAAREDLGAGVRHFPAASYLILYRLTSGGVEIIRYLHGSQQLFEALFEV